MELQDEDKRDNYLAVAATQPSRLLEGPKPRLFDEWQDAPKLWGAVRKSVDDEQKNGLYILTGSTSQEVDTPHTGTLRISTLKMQPMSLFESGESEGSVSLKALFDDSTSYDGCTSKLSIDELIVAICRGGWPHAINNTSLRSQLAVAKDLFRQTCFVDMSNIDGQKRNPRWAEAILRSYARRRSTATCEQRRSCLSRRSTIILKRSKNSTLLRTFLPGARPLDPKRQYGLRESETW